MTDEERIALASRYLGITPEQAAALPPRVLDVASGDDSSRPPSWLRDILHTATFDDRDEVLKFWRLLRAVGTAMTPPPATPEEEDR